MKLNNHRYIVIHEQPTSVLPFMHCFSCPVKQASGPWKFSIGKVIRLKITQRKKKELLSFWQISSHIGGCGERGILIEIKAGFAIFGALFLVEWGMWWAVLVDMPGFSIVGFSAGSQVGTAFHQMESRTWDWKSTWVWSCLGVYKDMRHCDKGIFGFLRNLITHFYHCSLFRAMNSENL